MAIIRLKQIIIVIRSRRLTKSGESLTKTWINIFGTEFGEARWLPEKSISFGDFLTNILPVKENLSNMGITNDILCPRCNSIMEYTN